MKLPSQEMNKNIVFIDKPAGLTEKQSDPALFVVHRLGKNMTGCLLLAKTKESAQAARQLFRSRRVKMKYLFVTDRPSTMDRACPTPDVHFQRIKRSPFFELWEVTSTTGNPRQVQILAATLKLPILGDILRRGKKFPHLCLHALELEIPTIGKWNSHEPLFMKRLGFLKDPLLVEALSAMDRQQRLFHFLEKVPGETNNRLCLMSTPEIHANLIGHELFVVWKKSQAPNSLELERWGFISQILSKKLVIQLA